MSCWDALCIEPTPDKLIIKKAYASLLKQHRPDEDPEGFAKLHAHYKRALRSKHQNLHPQTAHKVLQPSGIENLRTHKINNEQHIIQQLKTELSQAEQPIVQYINETLSTQHSDCKPETDQKFENALNFETEWQSLKLEIDQRLKHANKAINISDWDFLIDNEACCDIEFQAYLSNYAFEQLLSREDLLLDTRQKIAQHLNTIFRWSDKKELLETEFGHAKVIKLLGKNTSKDKPKPVKWHCKKDHHGPIVFSSNSERLAAMSIDMGLLILIQYGLALLINVVGYNHFIVDYALIRSGLVFLCTVPFLEASPLQGTPGKCLLNIKVVNKKGRRLSIFHAFCRLVCFFTFAISSIVRQLIHPLSKKHRLLHDKLSRSSVIQR